MEYEKQQTYNYFLEKIIDLELENKKLKSKNKEFENMHKSAQEVIKNLKSENQTLRIGNKSLWDRLNKET